MYLWNLKRNLSNLAPLLEVGNFYVVNEDLFKEYDTFKEQYDKCQLQTLLPCNDIVSLFMEKKGIKAQVIELFGRNFVHFSSGVADTLYEWMMDTRDHFNSAGYDAFN